MLSSSIFEPSPIPALRWLRFTIEGLAVPRPNPRPQPFGQRLAALRRAAGLTQQQLADKTGISRRMIAHYETQPSNPPSAVILKLARAVAATTDELLGVQRSARLPRSAQAPRSTLDVRLWRKLQKITELPEEKRRALLQVIDGFLAGLSNGRSNRA